MNKSGAPGSASGGADPAASGQQTPASHVDVLKALADPLRLNMLYALTRDRGPDPRAMTVKELAAELGEPQTKLYRHIKHLESAGLIRAVASRVVSGIVEYRYQASQADMIMGDDLTDEEKLSPEAEALTAAALELYRRQYFATRRGRPVSQADAEPPHRRSVMAIADGMVPASRAAQIYDVLYQLLDEVAETTGHHRPDDTAENLVPVNLLIGFFTEDRRPD
ncbi:MAG TPA: helix-turn-helix domain-containing protein [Streptosporangiaceae bacterium]|nr:helix-turn-helix domain-containing protein [Streptosporangiaceae bacterium]